MNDVKTVSETFSDRLFSVYGLQKLIAGISGGSVSTLLLHPLDVAKVRLQVNEGTGKVQRMFGTLTELYRGKGIKGLYQGLTPNLLGAGTAWGFYFFFYEALKLNAQNGDTSKQLSKLDYFLNASIAGALTQCITNPIWVTKTQMILLYESQEKLHKVNVAKPSFLKVLSELWSREGLRGFYRGMIPGLLGVSHGAIQFGIYEWSKNALNLHYHLAQIDRKLNSVESLLLGTSSKGIALILTYPYQVIRARLQDQHRTYRGLFHCVQELIKFEGPRGFYKGLLPNLLRSSPAAGITFVVYEIVNTSLKKWSIY